MLNFPKVKYLYKIKKNFFVYNLKKKELRLEIKEKFGDNKVHQLKKSRKRSEKMFYFKFDKPLQLENDVRVLFLTKKKVRKQF